MTTVQIQEIANESFDLPESNLPSSQHCTEQFPIIVLGSSINQAIEEPAYFM